MKKILKFNESIETKERLKPMVVDILNKQIANELESSQIYRAMSCWLDGNNFVEASKYFFFSAQEELKHMDKIYQYLFDMNCTPIVPEIGKVEQKFKNIREIVEKSLEHEEVVTDNWEEIATVALSENDNTTHEFAEWFNREQIEEMQRFRDIVFKINLDMPDWKIDELFGELLEELIK